MGLTQFDAAYSYTSYAGRSRQLIHLFKYEGMRPLAGPLGRWLLRAFPRESPFDRLVPVPMHWWKEFRRGFNQSQLLALELSRHTGIPVLPALRRVRNSSVQAGLSRAERRRNVQGLFGAAPGVSVSGLRLMLIDDVLTSGVTANACAAALKKAGAVRVEILTLARTDRRVFTMAADPDLEVQLSTAGVIE